jgi:acyl-CoA synthetase (AMP-forming)/AMP-acid ligase II
MTAILAGVPVVLPTRVTGEAAAIKGRDVEYVVGSPAQVDAFCQGVAPLSPRIGTLWVGGSIMTPDAVRHWLGYFERVILSYGAREGGGGGSMTLTGIDEQTEIAYTLRPDTTAEIVAEDGTLCPPSVPGILRLRTPTMASGYVGDPEASAEVFRNGWFYPGDLALLTPDGRLRILGRVRDQLNLGGLKFNAADIDIAARSVSGVVDAMCFTTPTTTGLQQLSLCAVRDSHLDDAATAAAIRAVCKARVNPGIELSAVYFVRALPINDNGKPVREEGPRTASGRPAF